ncbi:MAG: N-acetylglucosamine-6-phosphate deacetylase [Aliivibrio sp.]|uniref:N-acetylglucosamine-6-phosphate deacetylase n=1 Tax=Aliivibrio sp. TaxID=1872443 RepID=UPI001A5C2DB3|nr:N-acetylglucosamine-6-phosphate deacetylase [Aliivibrio sp.]
MRFALHTERIFTSKGINKNLFVVVSDGKVELITETRPTDCEVIEFKEETLLPGFIDIHIHGRVGCDVMDATAEALQTIANALPQTGVIAWVGTTVTAPWPDILSAISQVRTFTENKQIEGAELLGSFLEGPYFTERHRGSHPPRYLKSATISELEMLTEKGGSSLLRVAIAPESKDAISAIKWLKKNEIKSSVAHTNATFEQITQAYHAGVDCGVHLFNGMSGLHHREPGCAGAVLYYDMLAEIIADGIHVSPVMMQLAYRMKGYKKIALITDCMRAGGLKDGEYRLGAQMVNVTSGEARTADGSLAGSTCSLDHALRTMIFKGEIPEWEAVQMATSVPANYLGIDDRLGTIAVGMDASFTLVNREFEVQSTMIKGDWTYRTNSRK